jgi:hypothetical protein
MDVLITGLVCSVSVYVYFAAMLCVACAVGCAVVALMLMVYVACTVGLYAGRKEIVQCVVVNVRHDSNVLGMCNGDVSRTVGCARVCVCV